MSGVKTQHPDYIRYLPTVVKNRDASEGQAAIKEKFDTYFTETPGLVQLKANHPNDYTLITTAYKKYGIYENLTGKTIDTMLAFMFQTKPNMDGLVDRLSYAENNFDGRGTSIYDYSQDMVTEVIKAIHSVTVVSYADDGTAVALKYSFESMINWMPAWDMKTGKGYIKFIILVECIAKKDADEYSHETTAQYVKLGIDENGFYYKEVYDENGEKKEDAIYPVVGGSKLTEIPITVVTKKGITFDVSSAVIEPIADINIGIWNDDTIYKAGLKQTAAPTLVQTGVIPDEASESRLGSFGGICLSSDKAKAYFLEFQGSGLQEIAKSKESGKVAIGQLGLTFLGESGSNVAEAAAALKIKNAGDFGVMAAIAQNVSDAVIRIVSFMADGKSDPNDNENADGFSYEINKQFIPDDIDPQLLSVLLAAVIQGEVSKETIRSYLQKRNLYKEGWTLEDEANAIAEDEANTKEETPDNGDDD